MEKYNKTAKENYTSNTFSKLMEFKDSGIICDFTIKVGSTSFPVHRALLAAASEYFRGLFTSSMIEVQQGFIDMQSLDAEGVKCCLGFIYSGEIDLSQSPVEHTLASAHLMQLDILTELCFEHLKINMSVDDCLSIFQLAQLHDRNDVKVIADQYLLDNFEAVTTTKDFPHLDQAALLRYVDLSKADHRVKWQAATKWLSDKDRTLNLLLPQLIHTLQARSFPFQFRLETVLSDPLVQCVESCYNCIISSLFSNAGVLKTNLSLANFFRLREFSKTKSIPIAEDTKAVFRAFVESNFKQLVQKEEFCELEEEEIVLIFQSPKTMYSSEKFKWEAALKWVKYNRRSRKKIFPKLFKSIQFELLPPDFIKQTILNEPLVKESHDCKDTLFGVVCPKGATDLVPSNIVCLHEKTGELKYMNLSNHQWSPLPCLRKTGHMKIVTVRRLLYLLNGEKLLVLQNSRTWAERSPMKSPLSEHACVVSLRNRIYVVSVTSMLCYDPTLDCWNNDLPGCDLSKRFSVASSKESIYAMGGWSTPMAAKKFNIETQTWSDIASMKSKRTYAAANVFNGMVFIMGSHSDNAPCRTVECYNDVLKAWCEIKSMYHFRNEFGSCVVDNKLYAFGGARNTECRRNDPDSIEVFDRDTGNWTLSKEMRMVDGPVQCSEFYR